MLLQNLSRFYPISGDLRDVMLLAESLIIFLNFELVLYFIQRGIKARKKAEERQTDNVWGFFFLAFGVMRLFVTAGDFSPLSYNARIDVVSIGYLLMALGSANFVFFMERRISPRMRSHPLSVIFVALIAIVLILYAINDQVIHYAAIVLGVPFLILWAIYVMRIWRRMHQVGKTRVLTYTLGLFGLISGFVLVSDGILQLMESFTARVFGDFVLVVSLIALAYFFTSIPAWGEMVWKSKTQALYLFFIQNGLALFEHHFQKDSEISPQGGKGSVLDQDLLVPGLASIKELLERVSTEPTPPKTYLQEDAVILLEYGRWVGAAAICHEDLKAVRRILRLFIAKVEKVYAEVLPTWDGNLTDISRVSSIFQSFITAKGIFGQAKRPTPTRRRESKSENAKAPRKIKDLRKRKSPKISRKKLPPSPPPAENLPSGMRLR